MYEKTATVFHCFSLGVVLLAAQFLALAACLLSVSSTAVAQENDEIQEITVTARKRQESILNVPVVEQVIPAQKLEFLQINNIADLPAIVPGLLLDHSLLSVGTLVSIRGVGTSSEDPGVEQSVGLNIDGMTLTSGLAFNSGIFDLEQVEVLKGPQNLFYGKSNTAGVVSLRTADPTDQLELIARAGYEFQSIQPRTEFIISGPVTDTVKLRLAASYDHEEGYFKNVNIIDPGTGAEVIPNSRAPEGQDAIVRLTALWNPSTQFSVRTKFNITYDMHDEAETRENVDCPGGLAPYPPGVAPQLGGGEGCRIGDTVRTVGLDPAAFPNVGHGGIPFLQIVQRYGTVELNYRPREDLTVSSLTGYYDLVSQSLLNGSNSTFAGPFIAPSNRFGDRNVTEELRVTSDFAGPLNFTVGGLYQEDELHDDVLISGNTDYDLSPVLSDVNTPIETHTYSMFGQGRWKIVDRLELAAGVRWTDEKREETPVDQVTNLPVLVPQTVVVSKRPAPEVTLTYRPTDDMTLFGALKEGYKSGGFTVGVPPTAGVNNAFGDEKVEGGEFGLKSRWLDRELAVNIAPYYYKYSALQEGVISPPTNGLPVTQTVNAASAKVYGIDFDSTYRPPSLRGLELNATVLWNRARFSTFTNAPCWGGQTIALGCNQLFNAASGVYTAQNLSGTPLPRAPDWQMTVGLSYTMPVMDNYDLTISNSNQLSSRYETALAIDRPNNDNFQTAYAKVDLGLTLQSQTGRWEVALLAKNLTNKIVSSQCEIANVKGGSVISNPSGVAALPSPLAVDQESCFADPGREVWLRFTVRPFN